MNRAQTKIVLLCRQKEAEIQLASHVPKNEMRECGNLLKVSQRIYLLEVGFSLSFQCKWKRYGLACGPNLHLRNQCRCQLLKIDFLDHHPLHKSLNALHATYVVLRCAKSLQSCPALCDPMDCSIPGFPVLHHLLEHAQTHVN